MKWDEVDLWSEFTVHFWQSEDQVCPGNGPYEKVRPMISLTQTKLLGFRNLGPFFMVDVSEAKPEHVDSLCRQKM